MKINTPGITTFSTFVLSEMINIPSAKGSDTYVLALY